VVQARELLLQTRFEVYSRYSSTTEVDEVHFAEQHSLDS